LETAASKSQSNVSKTRKKGKNKRVAQAEIFDNRRSMATNGDSKTAENVKHNGSAAAAPEEPTKKADVPSSEKKKVQFFMNLEIGPRVDKKKEDPELADYEPRNDSESTSDDGEEGKSKGKIFEESDCVGMHHSAVQVGSLETVHNGDGLSGATISFADGSMWRLTQPLPGVRYQQEIPPFEARQVFECAHICNTHEPGADEETAIVKVKYQ
jgi:hypothetical protein